MLLIMSDYHHIDRCVCCDSDNVNLLLDLNKQPLANSYHDNSKTSLRGPTMWAGAWPPWLVYAETKSLKVIVV